jgi:HEAT repeat protein
MNPGRLRVRTLLLAAALVAAAADARAVPSEVKDPDFPRRSTAVKKAVRGLPEPVRQPLPPANENFLSPQQKSARAAEAEAETAAAVEAVRALSATRDTRVFEELVRGAGACGRMIPVADAALREATERAEKTRIPYFEAEEEEYRKTGKMKGTILVSLGKALDTLDWQQQEAAHALDYALRVRDAFVVGMGAQLELLGADGQEAWKSAARMGLEGKDPRERAAFAEAVKSLERPEVEGVLLAIEAKERDPVVLSTTLEALALRGSAEGFRRLVKRLDDPDPTIAVAAVHGVARYRSPETIPALAERLKKAEGRVYSDVVEVLFAITGKHVPDQGSAWEGWWKKEGESFLRRWSPDVKVRLEEIETIGLTDENLIDVPAELAALLPTETDAKARDAILENLSIHRSDFARITLLRTLYDPSKPTRLAAIRGLAHYRHVSVPEELIRVVARADADELQAIFQSLRTLWGGPSEFLVASADREKLLRWWDGAKERVPEQFLKLGARDIASGRKQSDSDETRWRDRNFYGLRVESDRVLFVVDVSLSMEEPATKSKTDPAPEPGAKALRKIDVAKSELGRVIRGLPDGTRFGLVFFSIKPEIWPEGLVPMNNENRKKAIAWVEALQTHFATNIYDAMEAAFQIGGPNSPVKASAPPDTIFLVSDGAPTAGKFLKPDTIREHVRRWNKGRNVKVHVIGVGGDHDVVFCRNLAEENGGFYIAR